MSIPTGWDIAKALRDLLNSHPWDADPEDAVAKLTYTIDLPKLPADLRVIVLYVGIADIESETRADDVHELPVDILILEKLPALATEEFKENRCAELIQHVTDVAAFLAHRRLQIGGTEAYRKDTKNTVPISDEYLQSGLFLSVLRVTYAISVPVT